MVSNGMYANGRFECDHLVDRVVRCIVYDPGMITGEKLVLTAEECDFGSDNTVWLFLGWLPPSTSPTNKPTAHPSKVS